MSCVVSCIISFIILILFLALITFLAVYSYLKRLRQQYKLNYAKYSINYCKNLPSIKHDLVIDKPLNKNQYDYALSKSLLQISLNVTQSNCLNISPMPNPVGFNKQYRIDGVDPIDNNKRMFATIFTNEISDNKNRKFIMAFTGTFERDEWLSDLDFPLVPADQLSNYRSGIQIHKGFYNIYLSIRTQLWNIFLSHLGHFDEFYITGHSLGGALSTIAAFDFAAFNPTHYCFASPRVGNVEFATTFDILVPTCMRVYNIEDVVTELPPPVIFKSIYQHVSNGIPFNINLGSIDSNHVQAYADYLPFCVKNIAPC